MQTQLSWGLEALAQPKIFAAWLSPLFRKDWVVCAKRPFGGPQQVLRYLGRYTHRVAISNHRLVSFADGKVTGRVRAHPELRLPGQPQTCYNFATLLSVARLGSTSQTRANHHFERCLALPQMWWPHAGHRKAYRYGAPAPFSADQGCRRRMIRPSTSRNFCVPRLATSLSVLLSNQSLFSTLRGHPHRTHRARVHALPTRASDTALRLHRS
jgi:hypothetical protein